MQQSAELYDPATGTCSLTGGLDTPRSGHTATLLSDGTVLFVGGRDGNSNTLASSELYNPSTGTFAATGSLTIASRKHSATVLNDGTVLIAGGYNGQSQPLARAEVFDPSSATFSATASLITARTTGTATALPGGKVLIAGGYGIEGVLGTAELYDPVARTFELAGTMNALRNSLTATLLSDGRVLIVGGWTSSGHTLASAELYQPEGLEVPPPWLEITPSSVTMLMGETRAFSVVDNLGRPRSDATWTVSDANLATLTTGDSITAIEAGQLTLRATILGVSAQAQITIAEGTSYAPGTMLWSAPAVPGMSRVQNIEAVRTTDGPDLYSVISGSTQTAIRALAADGRQLWQALGPIANDNTMPDGFGGLLLTVFNTCDHVNPMRIVNLDAAGQQRWQVIGQSACTVDAPQMAIRQDGSIVVTSPGNTSGFPELMLLNGRTGSLLQAPQIPLSTFTDFTGQLLQGYSRIGPPIVDADGSTYVAYEVRELAYPPRVTWASLRLLKIAPNGSATTTELSYTAADENLFPGRIVPDGQGGAIATWTVSPASGAPDEYPLKAARVSGRSVIASYDLPIAVQEFVEGPNGAPISPTMVLGENGTAFAAYDQTVVSFNLSSGVPNWSNSPSGESVAIVASTKGNGLVAKATAPNGVDTVVRFSSTGTATSDGWTAQGVGHFVDALWTSTSTASTIQVHAAEPVELSETGWYSPEQDGLYQARVPFNTNYNATEIETTALPQQIFDTYLKTFTGVNAGTIATASVPGGAVSGLDHVVTFTLRSWLAWLVQGPFSVRVIRFDPGVQTMAVETRSDHPLYGWRYWRVFPSGTNRVTIETGAFDRPNADYTPFGMKNLFGYYFAKKDQTEIWREYLEYIKGALQATSYDDRFITGVWGHPIDYIMQAVCGHTPTRLGFCQ